jgi:Flp pilus assembly protein TadD
VIALLLWTALLQAEHRASTDPQQQSLHAAEEAFKAGSAAAAQHDLAVAHREFAKVVRLAPKVAAGHTAFGAVLMEEGDTDAAVAQLELARRLDPADNSAALNLAIGYFRRRGTRNLWSCFAPSETRSCR